MWILPLYLHVNKKSDDDDDDDDDNPFSEGRQKYFDRVASLENVSLPLKQLSGSRKKIQICH